MLTNDEILSIVHRERPDLIYLAIGCARSTDQQYPTQVSELGGKQLCILIDPLLEDPISATIPPTTTQCLSVRRFFKWTEDHDAQFVIGLCRYALDSGSRCIVQDISGTDICPFFSQLQIGPINVVSRHILFDYTYRQGVLGGCAVDYSKVKIHIRDDGSFIQPEYQLLRECLPYIQRGTLLRSRDTIVCGIVRPYYLNLTGVQSHDGGEVVRQPDILAKIAPVCRVYEVPVSVDQSSLERLMIMYIRDLAESAGDFMSLATARSLVCSPSSEYTQTATLMMHVLRE